jgi:uracil-DNA glycosylase
MMADLNTLGALAWLVDAGADEAMGEEPVNRFQAKAPTSLATTSPSPLAGEGNANARQRSHWEGGESRTKISPPPSGFAARPLPQGEGVKGSGALRPTAVLNPLTSDNDHLGRAIEIANACNSLPELKAALEAFEGCSLKQFANTTVFADGNAQARILFIGEAPGCEEDKTGLPFVGRAGKLLDKMLAAIGLDRTAAYIINVLPWRPPDNRNPEATEVAKCIPFMRRHIELHAPELIVLLGGSPLRHVLGKAEGILNSRGKWQQYHVAGRMIPVMPTLHPAYLLRQPGHKKLAWRDLLSIFDKLEENHALER